MIKFLGGAITGLAIALLIVLATRLAQPPTPVSIPSSQTQPASWPEFIHATAAAPVAIESPRSGPPDGFVPWNGFDTKRTPEERRRTALTKNSVEPPASTYLDENGKLKAPKQPARFQGNSPAKEEAPTPLYTLERDRK